MSGKQNGPTPFGDTGVAAGLWRLALLRPDGVACFAVNRRALLAGLASWLAVSIVFSLFELSGGLLAELSTLLQCVCLVLVPPVLSHPLLRHWGLEAGWLRFATVYVWSQWLPNLLVLVLMLIVDLALAAGAEPHVTVLLPILTLIAYAIRLNWLVARTALGMDWVRTLVLLVWISVGVGAILFAPALLGSLTAALGLSAPGLPGGGAAA